MFKILHTKKLLCQNAVCKIYIYIYYTSCKKTSKEQSFVKKKTSITNIYKHTLTQNYNSGDLAELFVFQNYV